MVPIIEQYASDFTIDRDVHMQRVPPAARRKKQGIAFPNLDRGVIVQGNKSATRNLSSASPGRAC